MTSSSAATGDDRLRGGQDEDVLDGGAGDDYINAAATAATRTRWSAAPATTPSCSGRNDMIMVEARREKVKGPGAPRTCASHRDGCDVARPCVASTRECGEDDDIPCASNSAGCDEPVEEPCVATLNRDCDDPVAGEPEADPAARAPKPREPGA